MQRILGIGTDIVQFSRFKRVLEKPFADKICRKILHKSELEQYSQLQDIDLKTKFFATRYCSPLHETKKNTAAEDIFGLGRLRFAANLGSEAQLVSVLQSARSHQYERCALPSTGLKPRI